MLAFAAAFLVAFNVFSNYRDVHLPRVGRARRGSVDPLTQTTAGLLKTGPDAEALASTSATTGPLTGTAREVGTRDTPHALRAEAESEPEMDTRAKPEPRAESTLAETGATAGSLKPEEGSVLKPTPKVEGGTLTGGARPIDPHPYLPKEHTEYGGDVVVWGETNLKRDARACHEQCVQKLHAKPVGCNVWVYCGKPEGCTGNQPYRACWLKHQARPDNPIGPTDDSNPWTSGSMVPAKDTSGEKGLHKRFHVVVTTNANVYQAWQVRVMYYWYKKQKAAQGPEGQMGGFTRVLHDSADKLVDEIPTCVVDRLQNEMGFVVLSRPNAFKQFFEKCPDIEEDYILMAEPDHLYLRPLDNLMQGRTPAAFPFFYINPKGFPELIRRFAGAHLTDEEIEAMDPIGSSPVFIHKDDLRKVAPIWHDTTLKIKTDPEADKAWGWVLEMYGYTIAAKIAGLQHDLRPKLQAQPPWDKSVGEFYILHFTYGNDYDENGVFTPGKYGAWRFDKRSYMGSIPPKNLAPPPKGCDNELVKRLIEMINEASANLPNWENPLGLGGGRRALTAAGHGPRLWSRRLVGVAGGEKASVGGFSSAPSRVDGTWGNVRVLTRPAPYGNTSVGGSREGTRGDDQRPQ